MSVISRTATLKKLLRRKAYRDAYAGEHVKTSLPIQIRMLREQRDWTQGHLAQEAGTTQTVISRLEDPNYGNLSINSLLKLAAAFDIGLLVKFIPFSRLLREFEDVSPKSLAASSFEAERATLEEWATAEVGSSVQRTTQGRSLHLVNPPTATAGFQQTLVLSGPRLVVNNDVQTTAKHPIGRFPTQSLDATFQLDAATR